MSHMTLATIVKSPIFHNISPFLSDKIYNRDINFNDNAITKLCFIEIKKCGHHLPPR